VVLSGRLDVKTGSGNFKMVVAKCDLQAIPDTSTDPIVSIALATADICETL
jgi:hypothetical protein